MRKQRINIKPNRKVKFMKPSPKTARRIREMLSNETTQREIAIMEEKLKELFKEG